MRKLRWWEKYVQKITSPLNSIGGRLVHDWVLGSLVAGTAILSGVARALHSDKRGFEAALERLSRGFRKQTRAIALAVKLYRSRAVRAMKKAGGRVVAIDLSEVVKPYGRRLQYLCTVRDASKSSPKRAVIEKGWWTVEVSAPLADHRVLPLVRHAYSTVHPEFKSEQDEIRFALEQVAPLLPPDVRAVLDRGFDGNTFFSLLDDFFAHWAVRQRGDRDVGLPGQETLHRMSTVAKIVRQDHVARPWVVRHGELQRIEVPFGYCTVELPGGKAFRRRAGKRQMTLIVANHRGERDDDLPMMLLVSKPVKSAADARQWVEDYYRRWGAEEETRADKQLGGLEDLRVQSWDSIYNLVALSIVTGGLLALLDLENPRRARRLARLAPIDGDVPAFARYRLWLSLSLLLQGRSLGR